MSYPNLALSENGFLFDGRTGNTYSLSKTGTVLLRELIGGTQKSALQEKLLAQFDVEPDTAKRDVEQFLLRLEQLQLVEEKATSK